MVPLETCLAGAPVMFQPFFGTSHSNGLEKLGFVLIVNTVPISIHSLLGIGL
jgi:hypothetical protein